MYVYSLGIDINKLLYKDWWIINFEVVHIFWKFQNNSFVK